MFRHNQRLLRGYAQPIPLHGRSTKLSPKKFGGVPKCRPVYTDYKKMRPARPLRAVLITKPLLPVLYDRHDQLMVIQDALARTRTEMQVMSTCQQLGMGIRNTQDYLKEHMFDKDVRPSMHELWFHERGLQRKQHVLSVMPTHQMVPFVSLVIHDYLTQRMDAVQTEDLCLALLDSTVAHSNAVKREVYNTLVRVYVLEGKVEEAFGVIREMHAVGVRRNFITYAPLFRLARKNLDVDLHVDIHKLIRDVEGGKLKKWVRLDLPRIVGVLWVFVRFYWAYISCVLISISGLITATILVATGIF